MKDVRKLAHLDHERALAARDRVVRADAGVKRETAPQRARAAGTGAPIWPRITISAVWRITVDLPPMLGPVMMRVSRVSAWRAQVVGDEGSAATGAGRRADGGPARSPASSESSITGKHQPGSCARRASATERVELAEAARGFHDRRGLRAGSRSRSSSKSSCSSDFCREPSGHDLVFELLELFGEKALGADRRLLALIVRGRVLEMRLGDFDVVAENAVVADLERGDARRFALASLKIDQPLAGRPRSG